MKLEFLIPASPTPAFFSQVAMFRLALDRLGGPYAGARVVCVFGDAEVCMVPAPWDIWMEREDIQWVPIADFERDGYLAQVYRRFDLLDTSADLAVLCDADVLPVRPFGSEVLSLIDEQAVGGVIAHSHFPWAKRTGTGAEDWPIFSQRIFGRSVETPFRYTLSKTATWGCPFYINFGFLVAPPQVLRRAYAEVIRLRGPVREMLDNYFEAQVAFALATSAAGLPVRALPMRYNFPNDPVADKIYPDELRQVSMMHYLRLAHFNRQEIFASADAFDLFLTLELDGSNRVFQDAVRSISGGTYPFVPRRS